MSQLCPKCAPAGARHVARIFDRGLLASEASKLRQWSGGAAPAGSRGGAPLQGVRGAEPPEIFEKYGVVHEFWQ